MIQKIFSELGEDYKTISKELIAFKSIDISKYKANLEMKLRIAILIEKNYLMYTKVNEKIILRSNLDGLIYRILIPQYLLLIEKHFPKDLTNLQNILFNENFNMNECIGSNLFIINNNYTEIKKLKLNDEYVKINYNFLNEKLYHEIINKYFTKKYGKKVADLFGKLIAFPTDDIFDEFDELTIFKFFSLPFIQKQENSIYIEHRLLKHHAFINLLIEYFGNTTGRILQFAFEKKEFYDEELIMNTLISKNEIKLHTMRLYKLGYLQLINPEGSRIQKWKFSIFKAIECFQRDIINFINSNFGKRMCKETYRKYFSTILSLFFIRYAFKNI